MKNDKIILYNAPTKSATLRVEINKKVFDTSALNIYNAEFYKYGTLFYVDTETVHVVNTTTNKKKGSTKNDT